MESKSKRIRLNPFLYDRVRKTVSIYFWYKLHVYLVAIQLCI